MPGAAIQKLFPDSVVTFPLETSVFSTVVQSESFYNNSIFAAQSFDPNWYYNCLVTFSFQEKTVAAITDFINSNQPVSFTSHALMLKRADINKYPVP